MNYALLLSALFALSVIVLRGLLV